MKALFAGVVAVLALVLVLDVNSAGEKDKKDEKGTPKYKIKEVMKKAMDEGGLVEKVAEGTATAAEKKELVELFIALHDNTPPRGDKSSWDKVTSTLVELAKRVEKGEAKGETLVKVINCKACHGEFKGAKK
jgi:hypothetical protein